jgi:hypothetical protein
LPCSRAPDVACKPTGKDAGADATHCRREKRQAAIPCGWRRRAGVLSLLVEEREPAVRGELEGIVHRDVVDHFPMTAFGSQSAMAGNISSSVMQIAIPTMKGRTPIQRSTMVPTLRPASSETDLRMPWMM